MEITPEKFWLDYREAMRSRCQSLSFQERSLTLTSSPNWTGLAVSVAESTMKAYKLRVDREYMRLDLMGYVRRQPEDGNFDIEIAFEHENDPETYQKELCKLCHIVSTLRVLVAYYRGSVEAAQRSLQDKIAEMGERMKRVPNSSWLFILGPIDSKRNQIPWFAFTCEQNGTLVRLNDTSPFLPAREMQLI